MRGNGFEARRVSYCAACDRFHIVSRGDPAVCPACGTYCTILKCIRCGHTWLPRGTGRGGPKTCPRCRSPYWNRERVR